MPRTRSGTVNSNRKTTRMVCTTDEPKVWYIKSCMSYVQLGKFCKTNNGVDINALGSLNEYHLGESNA